jgi:hypothetical protein
MAKESKKINVHKIVFGFKTKNKEGFTKEEIKELLKLFPDVTISKFNKALGTNTCMMINKEIITYHSDIETAIRLCIEKRGLKISEFD